MADAFAADVFSILNFENMSDGTTITDEMPGFSWTAGGAATVTSGELILNGGTNNYIYEALADDGAGLWNFLHDGTSDVTLDWKFTPPGFYESGVLIDTGGSFSTGKGIRLRTGTAGELILGIGGIGNYVIDLTTSTAVYPTSTETVVSLEIEAGVGVTLYVDGTVVGTATNVATNTTAASTQNTEIGGNVYWWQVNLKAFRCTKALRYEGAHTPDTTPYEVPDAGPTALIEVDSMLGAVQALGSSYTGLVAVDAILGSSAEVVGFNDVTDLASTTDAYAVDFTTPSGVVRIPVSSWQATLQVSRANYAQCVIPAADDWLTEIAAATAFSISRISTIGGSTYETVLVDTCTSLLKQYYETPDTYKCVISGNYTGFTADSNPPTVYDRTLTNIRNKSTRPAGLVVRADIDNLLRPGRRAYADAVPLIVAYINYYVTNNDAYADYGERG